MTQIYLSFILSIFQDYIIVIEKYRDILTETEYNI